MAVVTTLGVSSWLGAASCTVGNPALPDSTNPKMQSPLANCLRYSNASAAPGVFLMSAVAGCRRWHNCQKHKSATNLMRICSPAVPDPINAARSTGLYRLATAHVDSTRPEPDNKNRFNKTPAADVESFMAANDGRGAEPVRNMSAT